MTMMSDRLENYPKWDTHLCPTIHEKIEEVAEESRCLAVCHLDGDILKYLTTKVILLTCIRKHEPVDSRRCTGSHINMFVQRS